MLEDEPTFPALRADLFDVPSLGRLTGSKPSPHRPRFLMLYGSVRERSYSRLLTYEAARLLGAMGAVVKIFGPTGLPLADGAPDTHPKVQKLRQLAQWAEGIELFKFTLLTRDVGPYLVDRYSEKKESADELSRRVNQRVL